MTEIIELKEYRAEYIEPMQRLLDQLTSRPVELTEALLRQIIADPNTHQFLLLAEGEVAGMLTVGVYYSPTGGKAWIEDVVVDNVQRGKGLSKLLVAHAIGFVKEQQVPLLMLTSNPKRIAANQLYQRMGFERKETNVYRMKTC